MIKKMTPNFARMFYDLAVAVLAGIFCAVGLSLVERPIPWLALALAPAVLFALNWLFGIYSRFKLSTGLVKLGLLTATTTLATLALYILSGGHPEIVLWGAFVWMPLFLPRYFLNINRRPDEFSVTRDLLREKGPVLVVGGAGYIGTHTVEQLLKANLKVRVLDNLIYDPLTLEEFMNHPRFELIKGDATDIVKLVRAMEGVSAVVHLAGLVGDPACAVDEKFTRHTNVITNRMVKEVALSSGVPRFVFASSCSVYGVSDLEVNEESELHPVSLYARTKIDSERELLSKIEDNFCLTILRFATVFGHSRRPRFDLVANLFTAQAMNEGVLTVQGSDQWRPFIHVRDLARAIVMVLQADKDKVAGEIFNVGDKRLNMTIGMLAEKVCKQVSAFKPCQIRELEMSGDRRNYAVSFDKIQRVLGFEAETLTEEGVQEMVEHFKNGKYGNYKEQKYSNLAMTRRALEIFNDPLHSARLYRPINDDQVLEGIAT